MATKRGTNLRDVIAEWEAAHGSFTETELASARKTLRS